jgi:hypothetical protein
MDSERVGGRRGRVVYWHLDEGSMSAFKFEDVEGIETLTCGRYRDRLDDLYAADPALPRW